MLIVYSRGLSVHVDVGVDIPVATVLVEGAAVTTALGAGVVGMKLVVVIDDGATVKGSEPWAVTMKLGI